MEFMDVLSDLVSEDPGVLEGVEVVAGAPEGLTVGEALVS